MPPGIKNNYYCVMSSTLNSRRFYSTKSSQHKPHGIF